ncbi:hypothetical protein K4A83_04610 [Spirulina subsalsa FACHB-351]|uniref:Uncharacterized protein n=1 Tax=Spirulina subsalsa FACHB-351 TaxID=234711 RepID=A0ABT3L225_9CYAN|nr:hypothetical protein [Spirulina subsalsa]MCW6035557.1 hypothetical protein [Spirulina subsalsa FACHB-351]
MLIPLTREKFEQLVPAVATGAQYAAIWGSWQNFLGRLLISAVGVIIIWLLYLVFGDLGGLKLLLTIIVGLYWLWSPVYFASVRNSKYRRFKYSGFWRGQVLDVFISDDVVSEAESFNQRGDLVIVENRERRINLEIGDSTGFRTIVKAPLRRTHKLLKPGQQVECLVMSNQPDLSRIQEVSDVYIPSQNLWVGEYPCIRRDFFVDMSEDIRQNRGRPSQPIRTRQRPPEWEEEDYPPRPPQPIRTRQRPPEWEEEDYPPCPSQPIRTRQRPPEREQENYPPRPSQPIRTRQRPPEREQENYPPRRPPAPRSERESRAVPRRPPRPESRREDEFDPPPRTRSAPPPRPRDYPPPPAEDWDQEEDNTPMSDYRRDWEQEQRRG